MAGDRTMNDDHDEPQFEHEEPAAQKKKKRTKQKRPRDDDDDDDATPGAPPILEAVSYTHLTLPTKA